jgi:hypothetical protein
MRWLVLVCVGAVVLSATSARAFCGFYIKDSDTRLTSRASRVVLLRDGTTTVLSMQSTYEGPPEDFALIVPVPSPIRREDVRTLDRGVFDRIDELTSPRLVEYWQERPICSDGMAGGFGYGTGYGGVGGTVRVEARFAVGEYDVVVLSASESTALERWLRSEGYRLPAGASDALRPYLEQGFRFFAARVDAARVHFDRDGRALLSPLRIRYSSESFVLPVRLGMLSSPGTQDLIVYVLSRDGRYEVANRPNVFVPTNLEVSGAVRGRFGAFYEALLAEVWESQPSGVITEYAWTASACDPCPGPPLSASDLTTLGGDAASGATLQVTGGEFNYGPFEMLAGPHIPGAAIVQLLRRRQFDIIECVARPTSYSVEIDVRDGVIGAARALPRSPCIEAALWGQRIGPGHAAPPSRVRVALAVDRSASWVQPTAQGFTVTRLHYRYGRNTAEDLVFRRADPIEGGTGEPDVHGNMVLGPHSASVNAFQARYVILHRSPPVACRYPIEMGWRGPADGVGVRAMAHALAHRRGPLPPLGQLIRTRSALLGLPPRRRR